MIMHDSNFLKENNARHMWHPMAHPAEMRANPPKVITAAEGVTVTDVDGHRTLDAVGGLWNVNLGYSCDPVKKAIADQLDRLAYYSAFRGTATGPAVELSHALSEWFAPDGLVRSFFTSGGSDSVETALRLARQYHKIRGDRDRTKFLSLKKGYHGTHFGGASVNGNANFRRNYEPLLPGCFHVASPYLYRNPFGATDPADLARFCLADLEEEIAFQGADTIAAFIMEPVLGAGGVIPPHESFMPKVREICDRHGILLILDEVMCGMGRTGTLFACEQDGVSPDICAIAKGLGAGYAPIGAMLCSSDIYAAIENGSGFFQHGHTYLGHPTSCAGANAVLDRLVDDKLVERVAPVGAMLRGALEERFGQHANVGDIRGRGLFLGIELVADRDTKAPLDPSRGVAGKLKKAAFAEGLICYPMSGTIDGANGDHILLAPPFILSEDQVGELVDKLDAAMKTVLG